MNRSSHRVAFSANGRRVEVNVEARATLVEALREHCGLTGTKIGCEQGACGACTVIYDGRQIRSCLMFAVQAEGADVWTIEGLSRPPAGPEAPDPPLAKLGDLADALKRHHGLQCGFCTPGMLIAASALGQAATTPLSNDEIREGLSGNMCRCTGYQGIIEAVAETFNAPAADDRQGAT